MSENKTTPAPADKDTAEHPRTIRSFVIRGGRLTSSQENALATQWPHFGLDAEDGRVDPVKVFGRQAPLTMEIGFGMGDSLLTMASENPERDFIGVEVHKPGVGRLLHEIAEKVLHNLRIYRHDAKEILRDCIAADTLDCIQIFFPDPWHKKRHNKRRLVQSEFVEQLRPKLKIGGTLHMATDWVPYAEHMMEVMSESEGFANTQDNGAFSPRPDDRPITKFEKRGERLGHGVWDLLFHRTN